MDLELSDEEAALRDNVRSVLAGIAPVSVVRAVYDGGAPPADLWAQMVELGWPALAISERQGGLGLGFVELALVAEELGRAVVPCPLLATATQFAPALRELGGTNYLPPVAAGTLTGTVALAERGSWNLDAVRTSARRAGRGWVLDGHKTGVLDADTADELVVVASTEVGLAAFVVPQEATVSTASIGLDPTCPNGEIRLFGVEIDDDRLLGEPGSPQVESGLRRSMEEAAVAMAASTVGACRKIFEATVEYSKLREQYGRPIGSFQALKHRMVDMYLSVERATALVYYAALTIAEDAPNRSIAAAAAKAAAGDCQRLVAEEGLQLHGGIGYTWEHDLHFWLKRAKVGDVLFGNAIAQRAILAGLLGITARQEVAA